MSSKKLIAGLAVWCIGWGGGLPAFASAQPGETAASASTGSPPAEIRLEAEPTLMAPVRTLVSTAPQTYRIEFKDAMDRTSVEDTIRGHAVNTESSTTPEISWDFDWEDARTLQAKAELTASHAGYGSYLEGEYQVDVNGAATLSGEVLEGAPVWRAAIRMPGQIWRYAADGSTRELLATVEDPYYFRQLTRDGRYLLGYRWKEYCECDGVIGKLYTLYDLQEKKQIRYPVELLTDYRGPGDFVVDRRGFFYAKPEKGTEIPATEAGTVSVHTDGYVHGANLSKDGRFLLMAVGKEDQEQAPDIVLYSLDNGESKVLAKALPGWFPDDPGMGRRMPIRFNDDGSTVSFILNSREPYQEIRYAYHWKEGKVVPAESPVPADSWGDYIASDDGLYRLYANAGLYRGDERILTTEQAPYWPTFWLPGTHTTVELRQEYDYGGSGRQYIGSLNTYNADTGESRKLFSGIAAYANLLGTSPDGKSIYVETVALAHRSEPEPPFGEEDGKLLAVVSEEEAPGAAVYLNDSRLELENAPYSEKWGEDGFALYVPLREVLEKAGWSVVWNGKERSITVTRSDRSSKTAVFRLGSGEALFNGTPRDILLPPVVKEDTTYLYAGVLQKLGMRLEWDPGKKVLFIRQSSAEIGTLVYPDGSKYEGTMSGATPEGKGMLFDKEGRLLYEGGFSKGLFQGEGTQYGQDGKILFQGKFDQGKPVKDPA